MERAPLDDADFAQWTVRRPADPARAAGDGRARKASVTGTGRKWAADAPITRVIMSRCGMS
jgi:hypothetical protein